MRVTKYIKDYVTEEVSRIYNAKKNPFEEEYKAQEKLISSFAITLDAELCSRSIAFAQENGFTNYRGGEWSIENYSHHKSYTYGMYPSCKNEFENWRKANEEAKQDKIREILISLELGETSKSELTNLIANLTAE
ncbi:MAG: hypothetical protein IIW69_03455 [Bacteroidaceae bacterium]|nr:hypothetical protein [Bacteroidaceae bacterium]